MFSVLPVEVLANLTAFLSGEDADRLWCCGNVVLNYKLCNQGGVTSYSRQWNETTAWKPSPIIRRSRLICDFDVHVSEFAPSSKFGNPDELLNSLPASLRSLRLAASNALSVLTGTNATFESRPTFLAKLTTINLCERFPSLNRLTIDARAGMTIQFFHTLPRNLETLVLEGVSVALDESKLPPFPATLRVFQTDAVLIFSTLDSPRVLPATLEELRCHTTLQDGILKMLPRKLTKLCLSHVTTRGRDTGILDWKDLPEQLLHFWINRKHFTPQEMADMPRSLTYLMLDTSACLDDSFVPHLPPGLTKLCMGYGITVEKEWNMLPRTLKWFGDGPSYCLLPSQLSLLPPALTRFEYTHQELDANGVAALPRSLRRLKLQGLSDAEVPFLPPCLTELTLNSETCSENGIAQLPQSLRYLCFNGTALEREGCFANLPRSLTRLVLRHVHSNVPPSALASLPKSITALHLHSCGTLMKDEWIEQLRGLPLRALEISTAVSPPQWTLSSAIFSSLPRSLEVLDLGVRPEPFGAEELAKLPPHLKVLKLDSKTPFLWTDADLIYLPRSLATIELPELQLSAAALAHLPIGLSSFSINQSTPFWFATKKAVS